VDRTDRNSATSSSSVFECVIGKGGKKRGVRDMRVPTRTRGTQEPHPEKKTGLFSYPSRTTGPPPSPPVRYCDCPRRSSSRTSASRAASPSRMGCRQLESVSTATSHNPSSPPSTMSGSVHLGQLNEDEDMGSRPLPDLFGVLSPPPVVLLPLLLFRTGFERGAMGFMTRKIPVSERSGDVILAAARDSPFVVEL
jgi:hypothetical protein